MLKTPVKRSEGTIGTWAKFVHSVRRKAYSDVPEREDCHSKALPNYEKAVLPREKLEKYVLDPTNRVGKHKAILFERVLGFIQSDWDTLSNAILGELAYHEATMGRKDHYGQRYNVTIPITGPNGRTAEVLTAWIVDTGEVYPRFITAYVE